MTKQIENISTVCLQTLIAWRKSDCLITVCQILGGGGKSGSSNLLVEIIIVLSLKDDDILIVHTYQYFVMLFFKERVRRPL